MNLCFPRGGPNCCCVPLRAFTARTINKKWRIGGGGGEENTIILKIHLSDIQVSALFCGVRVESGLQFEGWGISCVLNWQQTTGKCDVQGDK